MSVLFISLMAACAFLLAFIVILPWIRGAKQTNNALMAINVASFQSRLDELQQDKEQGLIDEQSYHDKVLELKRQLLAAHTTHAHHGKASAKSCVIVLVWIPLLMGLTYMLTTDRTDTFAFWQKQDQLAPVADSLMSAQSDAPPAWAIEDSGALINAILTNVHRHAHDPNRWMRLSELFISTKSNKEALDALLRAYRLAPTDEHIASTYAQIAFFTNDGVLTENTRNVLGDMLAMNPNHEGAMMLLAMGETRAGNFDTALLWVERLRDNISAKEGDHRSALDSLAQMEETIKAQAMQSEQQAQASAHTTTSETTQPDTATISLKVTVTVADALKAKLSGDETLFVAIGDRAGGAPYAVQKLSANPLKTGAISITLGDTDAMIPTRTLSDALQEKTPLSLVARVSQSGDPIVQSGDFSVSADLPSDFGGGSVDLQISEIVK